MRTMKIRSAAAALLLVCSGTSWTQETSSGNAANGARVYVAVGCFTCHGRAGQGGNFNQPAPPLAQIAWPVEAFRAFLRVAVNDMPAYAKEVLSDQDVADIHAFLRSLPGGRPPAEIALLND